MDDILTIEEIKKKYPNEWVLLGNPVIDNTKVLSGIVISHNTSKKELAEQRPEWWNFYDKATTVFTGEFPKNRRIWL